MLGDERRRGERCQRLAEQKVAAQAGPRAHSKADRDIDVRGVEIDQIVAHRHAHSKVGISKLEAADARAQPRAAEARHGADRQHVGLVAAKCSEGIVHRGKGGADRGKHALPGLRQPHAPLLAHEQRAAEAVFQLADLIADRRLRHPQLLGGAREVFQPCSRFKGADGSEGRQLRHRPNIRQAYTFVQSFNWRRLQRRRICAVSQPMETDDDG
jgi:hypothetical protein